MSAPIVTILTIVATTGFLGSTAWLFKSLVDLKVAVGAIKAQHVNNGGSTLRDAVDRIEAKVDDQGSKLNDHLLVAAVDTALFKQDSALFKQYIENNT